MDVAFFRTARLAHDGDFVAALERNVPFGILEFRDRNDAFGLVADVDDDELRRDVQHFRCHDLVFVQRLLGLRLLLLERLQSAGEVLHRRLFFGARGDGRGRCRRRAAVRSRRRWFGSRLAVRLDRWSL
jgi:hypothetical protein